jgi:predicted HD superfamily hydrolase involved in NAD metabolism
MSLTVGQMLADSRYRIFFSSCELSYSESNLFESYIGKLTMVLSGKRLTHSVLATLTALKLNVHYCMGIVPSDLIEAGMLHDCAREKTLDEVVRLAEQAENSSVPDSQKVALLHGRAGALVAFTEYGVVSPMVLEAIKYHTTGFAGGGSVLKLLIAADYLEPGRFFHADAPVIDNYPHFDSLLLEVLSRKIKWVLADRKWLSPLTVGAYNELQLLKR